MINAFDALLLVNSTEGPFPVKTQLSYEDVANPKRFCILVGYYVTAWGKEAVLIWEDGTASTVSVTSMDTNRWEVFEPSEL